ncbi:unnamed protein product [Discosporangium mesarthrocarpum]
MTGLACSTPTPRLRILEILYHCCGSAMRIMLRRVTPMHRTSVLVAELSDSELLLLSVKGLVMDCGQLCFVRKKKKVTPAVQGVDIKDEGSLIPFFYSLGMPCSWPSAAGFEYRTSMPLVRLLPDTP